MGDQNPKAMNPVSSITSKSEKALVKKALEGNCFADDDGVGFFECRICLDTAKDPIVNDCGHLFCWPCIYKWISYKPALTKECPVCRGVVFTNRIIPVHGHCSRNNIDQNPRLNVPPRPTAHRKDSWKDAFRKVVFSVPKDEIHRQIRSKIELNTVHAQNIAIAASHLPPKTPNTLLNWILTSKGKRMQENYIISPNDTDGSAQNSLINSYIGEEFHTNSTSSPGLNSSGAGAFSYTPLAGSDFPVNVTGVSLGQELHFPGVEDDIDDFSRLAADMQIDQMPESVVEVNSETNRRRSHDGFTVSGVDDDYSRPLRQRRLC